MRAIIVVFEYYVASVRLEPSWSHEWEQHM
jgi:hypothetical protein